MSGLSGRNGWGWISSMIPVTAVAGGVNAVLGNCGVSASVVAGKGAIRLTKIAYRVDLAPDVAPSSVVSPVYWRLVIFSGTLPQDVSALQLQAYPAGAQPQIPTNVGMGAAVPVLFDIWLDFSAGDPGLNQLAEIDFADSGPSVGGSETLNAILVPILDTTISAAPLGASNAMVSLGIFGTGVTVNPQGGSAGVSDGGSRSLPRYDVGAS